MTSDFDDEPRKRAMLSICHKFTRRKTKTKWRHAVVLAERLGWMTMTL